MVSRFTQKAQKALEYAMAMASQMGHTYIGSEHILLGLSADPDATAAKLLESKGVRMHQIEESIAECDGIVVGSPVYYASANATLVALLQRLFYSASCDKRMKVGAAVAVARRGGTSATFDELNKFFTISGMPVASSQYWNSVHGAAPGEALADAEGLQTMRTLARNMSFLMKSIALGKEKYGLPEKEAPARTNFIR